MNGQTSILKSILSLGIAGVIALAAVYVLWKLNSNDIAHLEIAADRQTEVYAETQKETNEVLRDVTSAIQLNTEVLRTLTR